MIGLGLFQIGLLRWLLTVLGGGSLPAGAHHETREVNLLSRVERPVVDDLGVVLTAHEQLAVNV